MDTSRHPGQAAPSGLESVRAEVAGLIKYRQLEVPAPSERALRLMPLVGRPNADAALLMRLVQSDKRVEGRWTKWHENGKKAEEATFKNGKMEGLFTKWDEEGKVLYQGRFKKGVPVKE